MGRQPVSTRLTSRIAARSLARQAQSLARADDLAERAEALIRQSWDDVLAILPGATDLVNRPSVLFRVQSILASLAPQLQRLFGAWLTDTARWSHRWTADAMAQQMPLPRLKAQLAESLRRGPQLVRDMPDYRQATDYDCGAACVQSVAEFFGVGGERMQPDYVHELGTTSKGGTSPDAIARWFAACDVPTGSIAGMTVQQLAEVTAGGRPVICPIQRPQATATQAAANAAGHYVVVLAVESGLVVYQDPLAGRQSLAASQFDRLWHDVEADGDTSDHYGIIVGRATAIQEKLGDGFTSGQSDGLPGFLRLRFGRFGNIAVQNMLSPLESDDVSDEAKRDLLRELVFPPPTNQRAHALVYAGDWIARLTNETKLAAPQEVADVLFRAQIGAKSIRDLAKDLEPVVNGVRSTARRIARDETLRVAHTAQWQAWQEVDELIVGYQVFAVDRGHSPTSRREHRERHGTVFYKSPKAGQKGMSDCPHPPYEANGQLAFNCRCHLSPVFAAEENDPGSDFPSAALDPGVAGEWFDRAGQRDRRAAVGAANYNMAERLLGRQPAWSDFTDAGGNLLSADALRVKLAA